jgi:hypothetical protein
MNGNDLFEFMTGRRIDAEAIDRLVDAGCIDPCEAEGWSMGNCMDAIVVRVVKKHGGSFTRAKMSLSFEKTNRREMLETIDTPECRFESEEILKTDNVVGLQVPPHIHNRRCNWTRHVSLGFDLNHIGGPMYIFVFYQNWVDSALYAGNVTQGDFLSAVKFMEDQTSHVDITVPALHLTRNLWYNPADPTERAEKKRERNRSKRLRQKERKRELVAEKALEEAERERERKEKDDGIDGIDKGKKGVQQLAKEEAARRRKELAKSHREWECLHPKQERIVVRGESHKETPKGTKPEPTMQEKLLRMNFEEQRGDRQLAFQENQKQEQQAALERRNAAKEAEEKKMMKEADMRIAQAANPKAPPLTLARAAGI